MKNQIRPNHLRLVPPLPDLPADPIPVRTGSLNVPRITDMSTSPTRLLLDDDYYIGAQARYVQALREQGVSVLGQEVVVYRPGQEEAAHELAEIMSWVMGRRDHLYRKLDTVVGQIGRREHMQIPIIAFGGTDSVSEVTRLSDLAIRHTNEQLAQQGRHPFIPEVALQLSQLG